MTRLADIFKGFRNPLTPPLPASQIRKDLEPPIIKAELQPYLGPQLIIHTYDDKGLGPNWLILETREWTGVLVKSSWFGYWNSAWDADLSPDEQRYVKAIIAAAESQVPCRENTLAKLAGFSK